MKLIMVDPTALAVHTRKQCDCVGSRPIEHLLFTSAPVPDQPEMMKLHIEHHPYVCDKCGTPYHAQTVITDPRAICVTEVEE